MYPIHFGGRHVFHIGPDIQERFKQAERNTRIYSNAGECDWAHRVEGEDLVVITRVAETDAPLKDFGIIMDLLHSLSDKGIISELEANVFKEATFDRCFERAKVQEEVIKRQSQSSRL